jgi:hypothetical protein
VRHGQFGQQVVAFQHHWSAELDVLGDDCREGRPQRVGHLKVQIGDLLRRRDRASGRVAQ